MSVLFYTVVSLSVLGIFLAILLYVVAQRFRVDEDPRIDVTEGMLPGANCGACGYPGCRGMADALVAQSDISALYCPVGGSATMKSVSEFLGKAAPEREPEIAVVRCAGSCALRADGTAVRALRNRFDGARSCAVEAATYGGETGCGFGCLGQGDCVSVCAFDAIRMNPETGLPEVDDEKCTACAKCVKACPKMVIELRRKGPKSRRVYVSCINKDKGAVARKGCEVACIGCGKCVKVCSFEAITLENNLAYIDPAKCKLCRKCVSECPTGSIVEVGFPAKKIVNHEL
jgi:Na+-translocating ferredoxin:NAD+ oxidoreductase RNF subunit RnfB